MNITVARGASATVIVDMKCEICPSCGMPFMVTADFQTRRQANGRTFYCPEGHQQWYTETELMRQQRRAEAAERQLQQTQARVTEVIGQREEMRKQRDSAHRQTIAQKAAKTRIKNRVAAGVCPVDGCRRHFKDLDSHIHTQHPEYKQADE